MSIRASISPDLELILSASEDGKIYIWENMELMEGNTSPRKNKDRSTNYETFYPTTNSHDVTKTPTKKDRGSNSTKSA